MLVTTTAPISTRLALILIAGCTIAILSFGPRSIMGLFLTPVTETRGWSREIFALAIALQNLFWGLGQPIAGMLADQYGTARVLAFGAVLYALGLVGTAYGATPLSFNLAAGVLMGLGMAAASFSIVLAAFGRAVTPTQRSIAFGLGTAAGSFGGTRVGSRKK